jgi:hypothetical protein
VARWAKIFIHGRKRNRVERMRDKQRENRIEERIGGAWRVQGMEIAPFLQEVETKTKASHRKKEP